MNMVAVASGQAFSPFSMPPLFTWGGGVKPHSSSNQRCFRLVSVTSFLIDGAAQCMHFPEAHCASQHKVLARVYSCSLIRHWPKCGTEVMSYLRDSQFSPRFPLKCLYRVNKNSYASNKFHLPSWLCDLGISQARVGRLKQSLPIS